VRRAALPPVVASFILVCATAHAAGAEAGNVEEARRRFQRGVTFYAQADYGSALVEFQEAYKDAPSYRLLFNIGQTYDALRDFAGAFDAFGAYLKQGGNEVPAARRAQVEAELRQLAGHVATLHVVVSQPDAAVVAEGDHRVDLGRSPLPASIVLNGGRWTLTATKPGFDSASTEVVLAGGDDQTVRLDLARHTVATEPVAAPVASPVAPVEPPVAPRPRPSRTPVWIGLVGTGLLAAGAGVTGALALGAKSNYDTEIARFGTTPADIASARSQTRTFAIATDVLGVAAIGGAVLTLILYFVTNPSHHTTGRVQPAADGARWAF
jgi:hypothetical protein